MPDVQASELVFTTNASGKKVSIVKIAQVKKGKAIGDVTKGRAEVGQGILRRGGAIQPQESSAEATSESAPARKRKTSVGVELEMIQMSMTSNVTYSGTTYGASMGGTAFGLYGYYDYPVMPKGQVRIAGAYEPLSATGSLTVPGCSSSAGCDFKVTYLGGYGTFKYDFLEQKSYRMWGAVGMGLLLPMSKSSSAVKTSNISTTQLYVFEIGGDIIMSRKNYIPLSLQYGMFPASSTVTASDITLRGGYAWQF